eukprot:TRINITY_DN758_c0_g1_i3.p3 TRINITY_DN758_c0_g1~~TRINITY_DN758_c0_g1_i3.p3  ORF type:complete len:296 (+),score=69.60 TRINITY_DN758_c0_g1_i3:243-1130(+)
MQFSNRNPSQSRISSLHLVNDHDIPMISVGSDDGVVRIWGGVYNPKTLKLVTSWRVLNFESDLKPLIPRQPTAMVLDWQLNDQSIVASGNTDVVKVWDVNKELSVQDMPTNCHSCITTIRSDKSKNGKMVIAGTAEGSVLLFDRRKPKGNVLCFDESSSSNNNNNKGIIISTFLSTSNEYQLISGSSFGEIKFWDVRNQKASVSTIAGHQQPTVGAIAIHDFAPLIAVGTIDRSIKVFNFSGEKLSMIKYHDGFLGQKIGPVSSLCFHPYKATLAAGATDSIVSIYAADTKTPSI